MSSGALAASCLLYFPTPPSYGQVERDFEKDHLALDHWTDVSPPYT